MTLKQHSFHMEKNSVKMGYTSLVQHLTRNIQLTNIVVKLVRGKIKETGEKTK